jgi:ABC-2 type transport system ATP-binding protein/lipopolysaccharide transport system ATP-binding protein
MDEWILAGDKSFMAKAEERISSFVSKASILVLASHSPEICQRWCNKAVWMEQGEVKAFGAIDQILHAYYGDSPMRPSDLLRR